MGEFRCSNEWPFYIAEFCSDSCNFTFFVLSTKKVNERNIRLDIKREKENKKHDEVTERKLAALTFEHYLNHRKLFIERMKSIESDFGNIFEFYNIEGVYSEIFHYNSPVRCDLKVDISLQFSSKSSALHELIYIYNRFGELFSSDPGCDKEFCGDFLLNVSNFEQTINLRFIDDRKNGDIIFRDRNLGVNIYGIRNYLIMVKRIVNSLLFFSDNRLVEDVSYKVSPKHRECLYDYLRQGQVNHNSYIVHFENHVFHMLHSISRLMSTIRQDGFLVFSSDYQQLNNYFDDENKMNSICREGKELKSFYESLYLNVCDALNNEEEGEFDTNLSMLWREVNTLAFHLP